MPASIASDAKADYMAPAASCTIGLRSESLSARFDHSRRRRLLAVAAVAASPLAANDSWRVRLLRRIAGGPCAANADVRLVVADD